MMTQVKQYKTSEVRFSSVAKLCAEPGDFIENKGQNQKEYRERNLGLCNTRQGGILMLGAFLEELIGWLQHPHPTGVL